jgi:hypothetical protein
MCLSARTCVFDILCSTWKRITGIILCLLDRGRVMVCSDLVKEPEGPRLISPFLMVAGEFKGAPSKLGSVFHMASQQMGFAQPGKSQRLTPSDLHRCSLLPRLFQERHGFGDAR